MLMLGLAGCGAGIALMARSGLGLGPWEVFHQGISRQTGIALGTVSILIGIPVLLMWWPLRQRPGIGTVINVASVGLITNATLALVPDPSTTTHAIILLALGLLVFGVGSGLYLGTGLGPGPRDGLMTGLHRRFSWSIGRARTFVEVAILGAGWWLGGTVGIGTLIFALGIGWIIQLSLRVFDPGGRVMRSGHLPAAESAA
jgi:uncharacterized membrane protein YczE